MIFIKLLQHRTRLLAILAQPAAQLLHHSWFKQALQLLIAGFDSAYGPASKLSGLIKFAQLLHENEHIFM